LADPTFHVKLFTPDSSWMWYVSEYSPRERLCFGQACIHEKELRYCLARRAVRVVEYRRR
jgi:hypothetical protein